MSGWGAENGSAANTGWGQENVAPSIDGWGNGNHPQAAAADGDEATRNEATPANDENHAADVERARAAGWTETTAFDYQAFERSGGNDADWHGLAKVYEWKDEYGDVAPKVQELQDELFGGEFQMRTGNHLHNLELDSCVEGSQRIERITDFHNAGLHPVVLENIDLAHYGKPTPIQSYVIPALLQGMDVVAISQTGSGKTAAYMIPIVSKLMGKAKKLAAPRIPGISTTAEPLVVIVIPTRELAIQTFDEARRMCYRSMLRPCVAYGGMPMNLTLKELGKGCDVLIATPGRLCDLMDKPHILSMRRVKYTVIDEADEMLHADWEEELRKIMAGGDTNEDADHVFMMFSATFPRRERELAREYLADDYVRVRVGRAGSAHKNIRQNIIEVDRNLKRDAVYDLLMSMDPGRVMIFCNSKKTVDQLDDYLYNRGLPTTSIHADRNQREREDALRAFRTGSAPIMIATGVSGRGWDVKDILHVVNYDLPSTMYGGINEYVHRIGRTARIGNQGLATSFYEPDRNDDIAQDLVNILVESECEVPEFLSQYKPEDGELKFDDDTDEEGEAESDGKNNDAGDASHQQQETGGGASLADSAWGAAPAPAAAADMGFTAAAPSSAAAVSAW